MNENCTTMPPSTKMPVTFLTLPRELRDEICTYAALSSSFAFLRTCRQLNEEGTPLLYKHGIYRRALPRHKEHLPTLSTPPPIHLIQNLYISMPPSLYGCRHFPNYEIPRTAASLLEQFRGTEIRRRLCHFDLQTWILSAEMAKGFGGLVGFEVVRVEVRFKFHDPHGRLDVRLEKRVPALRRIDEGLKLALGNARWEEKDPGSSFQEIWVAEFRPRSSTS